jgi:hypothetical protein
MGSSVKGHFLSPVPMRICVYARAMPVLSALCFHANGPTRARHKFVGTCTFRASLFVHNSQRCSSTLSRQRVCGSDFMARGIAHPCGAPHTCKSPKNASYGRNRQAESLGVVLAFAMHQSIQ